MDEARFWEIVDTVEWAKDFDYERIQVWMLKNLTLKECQEFRAVATQKWNQLDKLVGDRNPARGSDDSHSDLLYHVIGLGKEVFEANLADYDLLTQRGEAIYGTPEGYKESFIYSVPMKEDFNNHNNPNYFKDWAKKAKKEIKDICQMDKKGDLDPIVHDFGTIVRLLDLLIEGNIESFIAAERKAVLALERIRKFYEDNYIELPRKFTDNGHNGYNIHYVKNLWSDFIQKAEAAIA